MNNLFVFILVLPIRASEGLHSFVNCKLNINGNVNHLYFLTTRPESPHEM